MPPGKVQVVEGLVEEVIERVIRNELESGPKHFVGVVDPPRGGLHVKVLAALRNCKGLDRLIYVSCDQTMMDRNLNYLCLPANDKVRGLKGIHFSPV